jgi:hypothetical protein
MRYPNTAPITGAEKGWGAVIAVITFPVGLIALLGLLAGRGWGRWVGLVLGAVAAFAGVVAAVWLTLVILPDASYPYGPWFVFLAVLVAVLGLLAARRFLAGLRSTDTEA